MVKIKSAFVDVDGKGQLMSGRIVARRGEDKVFILVDSDASLDEWYDVSTVSELD